MNRRLLVAAAMTLVIGAAGCGPSAEQVREAQAEAAQARIDTARAQADARKAQIAAQQAQIAADHAQKVVQEDVKEINRACDHIDQILKERRAERESDN
ncbi:MAG TPA: hypothetical protein VMF50_15285 [Candidatus Binataceae bacterium]|nr:hypothetical protein [Candidatus Binataceae bacterium]